jgi:hypothetical protein
MQQVRGSNTPDVSDAGHPTTEVQAMKRARKARPMTWAAVQEIARALPGAVEGTSYGTPAFHVRKKLFVRLHQSRESIVIMIDMDEREALMRINPETFFITDHYLDYPAMLVRLATVRPRELRECIEESWRRSAPADLITAYDKP